MGLGGCYSVLKYFLVFFNLIFLIVGLAGTVFSIWMLVDPTFSVSLSQESTDYLISLCILLTASILLIILSIMGIYGACKSRQCPLITFASLLLVILVAEVATGVWAYVNHEDLEASVKNAVQLTVEQEYHTNDNRRLLFDTIQKKMHCCGANEPSDWTGTKQVIMTVSSDPAIHTIPESCCREGVSEEDCRRATQFQAGGIDHKTIYDRGCYTLIRDKLREHGTILLGVGIAIISTQLLALIFALILACAVSRSNRYKA